MAMSLEEVTKIVKQRQDAYMRGEMEQWEQDAINAIDPNATANWDRRKLKMKLQQAKIRKQFLDVQRASLRKGTAKSGKKFRAAKADSTFLRKQQAALKKLCNQYFKHRCHVLQPWVEFIEECGMASRMM